MMKLGLLILVLKQTILNIKANNFIQAIGIGMMTVSFLVFGLFILLYVNVAQWFEQWGASRSISVYIEDNMSMESKDALQHYLVSISDEEGVKFISKADALSFFKDMTGSYGTILEETGDNPLPASFEVSFSGDLPADIKEIAELIKEYDGVSDVHYTEDILSRFKGVINFVKVTAGVVCVLLALGVIFIVSNTIKLTIYSRKEQLEIYKLVGATDQFVKAPFIFEGFFHGIISGLISLGILYAGTVLLSIVNFEFFGFIPVKFNFMPMQYVFIIFSANILLGALGSIIAVGRFLEQ